jgi:hypothetical protein
MPVNTVTVNGTVRDVNGKPYDGALIEVWLNSQMSYSSSLYGNEMRREFSNSYGRFSFQLVPSSFDGKRENYYTFKIVKDTTNIYNKIVNGTLTVVDFDELPDYVPPKQRTPLLGNLNQTINPNPVTLPQELVGMFMWQTLVADGTTSVFSASGEVYFVALNGVVQSSGIDYVKRSTNVIEFINTPLAGDLVALQYRI